MSKINEFSGLMVVDNLEELNKLLTADNGQQKVAIELFDIQTKKAKNYDLLEEIVAELDSLSANEFKEINLIIPYEKINKKEFIKICEFAKKTDGKLKVNICVNHRRIDEKFNFDKTEQVKWDIETIIKANNAIDEVCNFIRERNFSPLEALAFIHEYVGSIAEYNASKVSNHTWKEKDQFFAGAFMQLPEVICAGYSSLEKEIIDNLNMPGLKCELIGFEYDDEDEMEHESHLRCHIEVDDLKYNVKQSNIDDTTWDRQTKKMIGTYDCFAMNNKCFDKSLNGRFRYGKPYFLKLNRDDFVVKIVDYDPKIEYNDGDNIDQHLIEKIYFSMLQKTNHNKSLEEIYKVIETKTKYSNECQNRRKYAGYIKSDKPILTKKEAKNIYENNKTMFNQNKNANEISF